MNPPGPQSRGGGPREGEIASTAFRWVHASWDNVWGGVPRDHRNERRDGSECGALAMQLFVPSAPRRAAIRTQPQRDVKARYGRGRRKCHYLISVLKCFETWAPAATAVMMCRLVDRSTRVES